MNDAILDLLQTGYEYQTVGRLAEAEARYRDVLDRQPRNVHALNLLGVICINTDRAQEAVDLIATAIGEDSEDAEAYANLGLAQKDLGNFDAACSSFQKATALNPGNPVTHNNLGNVLAALDRNEEAVASYRQALQMAPDYAECLSNLAAALKELGQLEKALAAADRALQLRPQFAEAHNNRGEVLFAKSRFDKARDSYQKAIDFDTDYVAAMINLSAALKETGDIGKAQRVLEEAIRREPDNARAYNNLGVLLEQLGQSTDAAAAFRDAIRAAPDYSNAYYQLAQLRGHGLNDAEVETVTGLLDAPGCTAAQRMPLSFALACAYESRGDFDRSFEYLASAQTLKAQQNPYDDDKVAAYYAEIATAFAEAPIEKVANNAERGPRPVFVLGMPRSGTTLTEQILDSHPDIAGVGELSFMEDTVAEAGRLAGAKYPACIPLLDRNALASLGKYYLNRIGALADGAAVVVDKTPMNFQYIGFIFRILPGARVIHCTRDPIDNCLSIFKLPFEKSHSYAHDLAALGRYYRRYRELMATWESLFPERITDVRYEELVTDVEAHSRRMLDFLELQFDERVLAFHEAERIVKTPSASQVRQPIYTSSVQRWRKYERHLGPLIEQLEGTRT